MMWADVAWSGLSFMYDVGRCCLEWTVFYVWCGQMLPGVDCLLCMMWADVAWSGLSFMYDVGRCCLSGLSFMYDVGRCCLEWTVFYV